MHTHHHHTLAASESGSVVLDIGADVGALVLYVPAAELGREIEISASGTPNHRTHVAVRERIVESGSVFCLVYPALAQGDYTIWSDETRMAGSVHVVGGQITELDWTSRHVI